MGTKAKGLLVLRSNSTLMICLLDILRLHSKEQAGLCYVIFGLG